MANGSDFFAIESGSYFIKNRSGSDFEKYRPCVNDSLKFKETIKLHALKKIIYLKYICNYQNPDKI